MMENAARARRWMLLAAPVMVLSGALFGAGGAAAGLALWMGLRLLLDSGKGRIRMYPKQRRMKIHRLFLGYAFCIFCLTILDAAAHWLTGADVSSVSVFLLLLGGIGFSLPLGAWALQWRVRRKTAVLLGCFLCASCLLFLLLQS